VGTLTGSAKDWSLSISGVTAGAATVKITKDGITDAAGTITLYRSGVPEELGIWATKADAIATLDAIIAYAGTKQPIKDWAAAYKTTIQNAASLSVTHRTEINEMLEWIDINGPLWTAIEAGTGTGKSQFHASYPINDIAYGGSKFVAVGNNQMATSPDGITWTAVTSNPFSAIGGAINAVAYGGGKWVAAATGGRLAYATDPSGTWTDPVDIDDFNEIYGIVYDGPSGQEKFFVAGSVVGPISAIAYSTNGSTNWTVANSSNDSGYFYGIAYGGGNFVTVGKDGSVGASPDGITWTVRSTPDVITNTFGSTAIKGIAYGGGRFVVVGENGKIAYSDERE
jgi:hypothetical protein